MKAPAGRTFFLLALLFAASACASSGAGMSSGDPERLTTEEIQAQDVQNAYDLVQRLRPRWLTVRGGRSLTMDTQILVFLNGVRMGGVESLRQVDTGGIVSMRYLDGAQATSELPGIGSQHVAGAIVISTNRGRR